MLSVEETWKFFSIYCYSGIAICRASKRNVVHPYHSSRSTRAHRRNRGTVVRDRRRLHFRFLVGLRSMKRAYLLCMRRCCLQGRQKPLLVNCIFDWRSLAIGVGFCNDTEALRWSPRAGTKPSNVGSCRRHMRGTSALVHGFGCRRKSRTRLSCVAPNLVAVEANAEPERQKRQKSCCLRALLRRTVD